MFHSIKRLLHWAGGYRKRLYLGCLCSFFSVWCTAIPIVIAAWTLGLVIADFRGENSLEWNIIWLSLFGIVISIFLRYIFSYWKAKLQESIGYEIAAEERLKIGNVLKRVSLGYFSKNSTGDILTAITGDLSSLELQGMKLIDAIVNGYINLLAIVIILLIVCPMAALTSLVGAILSALALNGISKKSRKNAPAKQISQERITDASLEYIHGLPIVKSFGQEGASIEEWKTACEKHKNINLKIMHGFVPNNCLHLLALKIASVLLILISGIFTIQGNLTISIFLLIAMFAFMIFGAVENMNDSVHMLGLIDTSMDKLENIENAEFIDEAGRDFSIASYNIDFTDVSFGYGEIEVLHNLSFQIPQNTTTASDLVECVKDSLKGYIDNVSCLQAILDGIDQSSINQALANEYSSHIAANEQQVEQALEFKARLYESLITGTISKEEYTDYKARYTRIAENAKESIRVLKEKLADVLENRSERNRWISHFTQFSTMETLDRKAVVHMIQSIKVIGKKELEITFTYQDEYQKAIQLIQLAEQTSQRKVG